MEWIKDYWYVLVLGLIGAMILFGFRTQDNKEGNIANHRDGSDADKKEHKSGGSCCH